MMANGESLTSLTFETIYINPISSIGNPEKIKRYTCSTERNSRIANKSNKRNNTIFKTNKFIQANL